MWSVLAVLQGVQVAGPSGSAPSVSHRQYKRPIRHSGIIIPSRQSGLLAPPLDPGSAMVVGQLEWPSGKFCSF